MSTFDERAHDWDDKPGRREHAARVADTVVAAVGCEDAEVLELGAGTGLLAFAVAERRPGWRFTLTDTSAGMREVATARIAEAGLAWEVVDVDLSAADPATLERRFDVALTHLVLHHVADIDAMLCAIRAVLRPGGVLVALDLTPEGIDFHDRGHHHGAHGHDDGADPHHHHDGFGEAELADACRRAGFDRVEWSEPLTVTRERDGVEREFPLFCLLAHA